MLDSPNKIDHVQFSASIFNFKRKDFEKWIGELIGDSVLADRISNLEPENSYNLKMKLLAVVHTRIKESRETLLNHE